MIKETTKIVIETTSEIRQYLEDLVDTGLFGVDVEEAAERVLSLGILDLTLKIGSPFPEGEEENETQS